MGNVETKKSKKEKFFNAAAWSGTCLLKLPYTNEWNLLQFHCCGCDKLSRPKAIQEDREDTVTGP